MRNFVILGSLIATTAVAAAEPPGLTARVDAAAPAPQAYVSVGGMAGMDGFLSAQVAAEAGYHLNGALWLHGLAATGGVGDDQGSGPVSQARGGVEARTCRASGIACAYAGLDVGYQNMSWESHDGMVEHHSDAIANLRVGVDVGGQHVRVRSGLETYQLIAGDDIPNHAPGAVMGLDLNLGVAYQW